MYVHSYYSKKKKKVLGKDFVTYMFDQSIYAFLKEPKSIKFMSAEEFKATSKERVLENIAMVKKDHEEPKLAEEVLMAVSGNSIDFDFSGMPQYWEFLEEWFESIIKDGFHGVY